MKHVFSKKSILLVAASVFPVVTFADFDLSKSGQDFRGIICSAVSILNLVIPILIALSLVFFFWGLSKFIINSSGNEKELQTGKSYMMWGILALFILFTFRAIVGVVTNEFEFGKATGLPLLPGGSSKVCGFTSSTYINFEQVQPDVAP